MRELTTIYLWHWIHTMTWIFEVADGMIWLGAGAFLGPGARLLDRTRLPTREPGKPARVGELSRVGGNAVVCGGITVGRRAIIAAGEVVEDDVPDNGVWMGGKVSTVFEGPTWEQGRDVCHAPTEGTLSRQRGRRPRRRVLVVSYPKIILVAH
jgi:acetyltransferase-like isoleucine patch superfamily enzyme